MAEGRRNGGRLSKGAAWLLSGALSVSFAEVLAGSSQLWFANPWGLGVVLPLYMCHLVFFFWLAVRFRRLSLAHLYLLGVMFGLYEAVITKVLWAGYAGAEAPGWGHFAGLAMPETLVLVGFWHPLLAFVVPLLAYQILTGQVLEAHARALTRRRWKTALVFFAAVVFAAFVAVNGGFDASAVNGATLGSVAVIFALSRLRPLPLVQLVPGKWGARALMLFLILFYVATGALILPERFPQTPGPYLSILAFYGAAAWLFLRLPARDAASAPLRDDQYQVRHLLMFAAAVVVAANLFIALPGLASVVVVFGYLGVTILGALLLLAAGWRSLRRGAAVA